MLNYLLNYEKLTLEFFQYTHDVFWGKEQFELCLKLQKEQNALEEDIHDIEEKKAALKELMKSQTDS